MSTAEGSTMLIPERLLLYVTSLVLGGVLFLDRGVDSAPPGNEQGAPEGSSEQQTAGNSEPESIAESVDRTVLLQDESGQPRVQLDLNEHGVAAIELKDAQGNTVVVLSADAEKRGTVRVQQGDRFAGLTVTDSGALKLELSDAAGQNAVLQTNSDRSLSLRLESDNGCRAEMRVMAAGETEISARSGKSRIETVLRTDSEGGGEVAVHNRETGDSTSMSLLSNGDAGLRVFNSNSNTQAIVQVFQDGLAEVAVKDNGDSQGGSRLVRLPNGGAVVSARLPNSESGASMVVSPEGVSVVSAKSKDGENQAALWVDKDGAPSVYVSKPQSRPNPKPTQREPQRDRPTEPIREAAASR